MQLFPKLNQKNCRGRVLTDPWTKNILLVLNHGSVKTEPYFLFA